MFYSQERLDLQMKCTLKRVRIDEFGILGLLEYALGTLHTLEHNYNDEAKIPSGTYKCIRGIHHLGAALTPVETFEVTGVAGHTGLLFHTGNYNSDSNGCILLGQGENGHMIIGSRDAFKVFMASLEGINEFTLEVL